MGIPPGNRAELAQFGATRRCLNSGTFLPIDSGVGSVVDTSSLDGPGIAAPVRVTTTGATKHDPMSQVRIPAAASLPHEMVGAAGQASADEAAVLVF